MLLAIDIGNTNTVFAVFKGQDLLHSWRCQTESKRSADEYAAFLKQLFDVSDVKLQSIKDIIISSVVPESNFHVREFCTKYLKREAAMVTKDCVPITLNVDRPEDVGADRLVNAVAVSQHYQLPAIVIDFGTATTFDVITADGAYSGGVIAPGVNLSIEALNRAAAKLPKVSIKRPPRVTGKATVEAIQSGMYWGYLSLIEGLTKRLSEELGEPPFVLATGGLAPLFAQETDAIDAVDNDLTLKGLLYIHQNQSCEQKEAAND